MNFLCIIITINHTNYKIQFMVLVTGGLALILPIKLILPYYVAFGDYVMRYTINNFRI